MENNFFYTFLKLLIKTLLKKFSYVIRYTFQSNLLLVLILDLGKCHNQKMHENESAGFLLRHFPGSTISSKRRFD